MVEASLQAPDDVRPWPGILTQPRRALRAAADERIWVAPALLYLAVGVGVPVLRSLTGAPPSKVPPITGHPLGDVALSWVVLAVIVVIFPFGLGRLAGGRATLAEVFIVTLWGQVPGLLVLLPVHGLGLALHGSAWWSMQGSIFKSSAVLSQPVDATVLNTLRDVAYFWCLGLGIIGLSEVHRLPARRIFFVIILPLFVLGVIAAVAATILVAKSAAAGG